MKKLFTFLQTLPVVFFLSLSFFVNAQTHLDLSYKGVAGVPNSLNICGDFDDVIVTINATGFSSETRSNIEAAVNLFKGVEFAAFNAANSTAGVSVLDDSDVTRPLFNIPDLNPAELGSIDLAFSIIAKCGIVDTLNANNAALVFDTWDLSYDLAGESLTQNEATIEYRDAFAITFFTVEVEPNMVAPRVGDCYNRRILVSNSGLNGFVDEMLYTNIQGSGVAINTVTVNGTLIPVTKSIGMDGDTIITAQISGDYFTDNVLGSNPGNGDQLFDPNETLEIIENICITSCEGDRSSLHTAAWGCDDDFCQQSSIDDFIQLGEGNANVIITVSDTTPSVTVGYCQTGSTSITVANDGFELDAGFANMLNVELGIGMGSDFDLADGGFNAVEVLIGGVAIPTTDALVTLEGNPMFENDIDGPGGLDDVDNDGYYDDLPLGESVDMTLRYDFDCSIAQSPADECFNDMTTFFSARVDYFDVACNMEITRFRNSYLRTSNTNSEVENFSTPDAFAGGEPFRITHFETRTVREFVKNCGNDDILIATIELPDGINPIDSDTWLTKNGASTPLNVLSSTVENGVWTIQFDTSDDEFLNGNYEMVLGFQASCDAAVGHTKFPFKFEFYCPECDCTHTWYCNDLDGPFIHKDVPPCPPDPDVICEEGLKTMGFDVFRSTFGFTETTYTTPFNPADANKKVGVSCDSVEMIVTTEVGETPISGSIGFVVNYNNVDGSNAPEEIFLFNNGVIKITSGGTNYTCLVTPANLNVTSLDGFKTLRFEVPNCLSDLGLTLNTGDQVSFIGNFSVNTDGPYLVQFKKIPNFRAYGFSVENGIDAACESFGDIFTIAKTNTLFSFPNSNSFPEGCAETFLNYRVISIYNGFDDHYGDELYPSIKVDSITFDFDPAVLEGFDVFEPQVSIPGHPIHGDEYFTVPGFENFVETGQYEAFFDTLNVVPSLNQVRSYSFSFRIRTIPNCRSGVKSANGNNIYNFDPTVYYQNRYYAKFIGDDTCVEPVVDLADNDIQYAEPPTFSFNPVTNPDVFLLVDTAVWEVQLCNTSFESDAGLTWFAVENLADDIEVVSIQDISIQGAPQELDFITYGTAGYNAFAFADGVTKANGINPFSNICNTIRIKVIPQRCGTLNLSVRTGWNCIPYAEEDWNPELYTPCEDNIIPLSIVTQDPFLEANISDQPGVAIDLCEPLDITILLRNEDLGTTFDMKTQLFIPLEGATLVPGSIEFAYPSGAALQPVATDPVFVGATPRGLIYEYQDFSQLDTFLDQQGLEGFSPSNPTDSNEFRIKYSIVTDCDFISNSLSYYNFQGLKGCKDSTNLEIGESLPIEISGTGSANGKLYDIVFGTGSQLTPNETTSIDVVVTNLTTIPSSETEDLVSFTLPEGVDYVVNSSTAINPDSWTITEPTTTVNSDITTLIWNLPAGLMQNDKAQFRFDLTAPNYDCSVTAEETRLITIGNFNFNCVADNSDCESMVVTSTTGDQIVLLPVNSSSINYAINNITTVCTNTNEEQVTVTGTIQIGTEALPAVNFPINYYVDMNGNGVFDTGETQLGTFEVNGPVDANTIIPFTHEFAATTAQICQLIFRADATSVLDGDCEFFETTLSTPQLLNAGGDFSTCTNGGEFTMILGVGNCPNTFLYNWSAIPSTYNSFLDDTSSANPTLNFDPNSVNETEILYVLETARPDCGTTVDTVVVTLNQAPVVAIIVPDGASFCPGTAITLTPNVVDNYTYIWTNVATNEVLGIETDLPVTVNMDMTILVTATDPNGCETSETIFLTTDIAACPCTTPVVTYVLTEPSTCGNSIGTATVNVQDNAADFVYTWSPELGTSVGVGNNRTDLLFGGYNITVADPTNEICNTETFAVIQNADGPQASAATTPATCEAADGTAFLSPSNYTYIWSDNNVIASSRTDLKSGVYFVTFTDPADPDCPNAMAVIVGEDNPLEATAEITKYPACNASDGGVTINVTGGSGSYDFLWADGDTNQTRTDLVHGVYAVTITDLSETMCELPFLFVLAADVPMAEVTLTEVNDVSCFGANDGSAFFDAVYDPAFVGTADTILTNSISEFINGSLPPGTYCYVIEDGNMCTAGGDCFTIEQPDPLQFMTNTTTDCGNGGSINIMPLGGTPAYQFDWADVDGVANSSYRQNLPIGTYDLNLSDVNGCVVAASLSIGACNCTPVNIIGATITEATCGNADGTAIVNLDNDPMLYTYTWSPDIGTASIVGNMRTNLPAGSYAVTVTDANSAECTETTTIFVSSSDGSTATIATTPASCAAADGTATLFPASYIYQWGSGIEGNTRTDLAFGNYTVTVIDPTDSDCPGVVNVQIAEDNPLLADATITTNPECGESNGAVSISVTNGSGNYGFIWEDGAMSADRTDLAAGLYRVTITDNDTECQIPFLFVLTDNIPQAVITITDTIDVSCFGLSNGEIAFSLDIDPAFAGIPISAISDGFNTFENGFLPAGYYCMTINDGNGCFAGGACFTIEEPDELQFVATTTADCGSGGSISILATGGIGLYQYDWADVTGTFNSSFRQNLSIGTYHLNLSDANGCALSSSFEIGDCSCQIPTITSTTILESTCGVDDGQATINLLEAANLFTYTWSPDLGVSSGAGNVRTELPAGTYTVVVADTSNISCSTSINIFVNTDNGSQATVTTTPASCNAANGSATLLPETFMYMWEGGFEGNTRSDLAFGVYQVTIVDPADPDCPGVANVLIIEDNPLLAEATTNINPTCGENNGSVSISVSGGSGNYSFVWADGDTNADKNDLAAGLYVVNITDNDTGCNLPFIFVLTDAVPQAAITITDTMHVSCFQQSDGGIDFDVVYDPAFVEPSTMIISNGFNTFENGFLPTGNYCMAINDGNGCYAGGACFTINEPDPLQLSFVVTPACLNQGTVTVEVTGGTSPYIYDWADINGVNDPMNREGLSSDTLSLTVVDQNDCMVMEDNILIPDCLGIPDCGIFDTDTLVITALSCNTPVEFCVSIPFDEITNYEFSIDGTVYTDTIGACDTVQFTLYDFQTLAGQGNQGPYELIGWAFNDTLVSTPAFDNLTQLALYMSEVDLTGTWLYQANDLTITGGGANSNYLDMQINATVFNLSTDISPTTSNMVLGSYIQLDTGFQQIVLTSLVNSCMDTIYVDVTCPIDDCDYFSGLDSTTILIASCEGFGQFCLKEVTPEAIGAYEVYVDTIQYFDMIGGCLLDSIGRYDYDQLAVFSGPYTITGWTINDSTYVDDTLISTITELVGFMNEIDTIGNWVDNPDSQIIIGDDYTNAYGKLELLDTQTGTPIVLGEELTFTIIPSAVYIELELGIHEVVLFDTATMCADTIVVTVADDPILDCRIITDIINPYDTVKYVINPDMFDVMGDTLTVTNVCEEDLNGSVEFVIDSLCVTYIGNALGVDTACIEICDELGTCDTLIFDILVVSETETIYDTLFISQTDTFCLDTTIFLGVDLTIIDFCADMNGEDVDFFIDPTTYCIEYTGLQVGTDTACIALCDELGYCDTTYFQVTVIDVSDTLVAVNDTLITNIGEPIVADIKANDLYLGTIDTAYILDEPMYGEAFINLDCSLTYNPNAGICDITDSLTYVICNAIGCDTATVSIYIDCQGEIIIYTAVSPNGDNANDVFFIAGIEYYPNNELCIFNRWGNQVYLTKGYQNNWSGTWDGNKDLPDGTYYYMLQLNDEQGRVFKGYFELFR